MQRGTELYPLLTQIETTMASLRAAPHPFGSRIPIAPILTENSSRLSYLLDKHGICFADKKQKDKNTRALPRRLLEMVKSPHSPVGLLLAVLLRPVSLHALALSLVRSIGCVLGDGALRRSFNPADVFPSCPAECGRGVLLRFYLHSRLASHRCCSDGALLAFLRRVIHNTLALFCSALGRFLGRWYFQVPALLSSRC